MVSADPLARVRIVGTGLIGTSIGLALREYGGRVTLVDISPTAAALARDLGAGELGDDSPDAPITLVVVAAPPDVVGGVVARELRAHATAVVTDVASVKAAVLRDVAALVSPQDLTRYVGSHPMAGRERSGAVAAQADLFDGRPWVVTPHATSDPAAVQSVEALARFVGSAVRRMAPEVHDEAVAAVSHVPQVAASLVAAALRDLPSEAVGLAGQGLRDVTRIAASNPMLWTQILAGNAAAVRVELTGLRDRLTQVVEALGTIDSGADVGSRAILAAAIADGNAGHARIPGKHGPSPQVFGVVAVVVPDEPGALARLFADIGEEQINLEDVRLEHGVGRLVGVAEVSVVPSAVEPLVQALRARGWTVHL